MINNWKKFNEMRINESLDKGSVYKLLKAIADNSNISNRNPIDGVIKYLTDSFSKKLNSDDLRALHKFASEISGKEIN